MCEARYQLRFQPVRGFGFGSGFVFVTLLFLHPVVFPRRGVFGFLIRLPASFLSISVRRRDAFLRNAVLSYGDDTCGSRARNGTLAD